MDWIFLATFLCRRGHRQIRTTSGRRFQRRAPAGDLARHCLPQALPSANRVVRGSGNWQPRGMAMGGRDGGVRLPRSTTRPRNRPQRLHRPRAGLRNPPAPSGRSPELGSARETNIDGTSAERKENIWHLRESSWSGSHCVFSVHALFLYSLVSRTFRREIISCVGPSRSRVGAEGDLPVVNSPWITCWSPLGCRSTRRSRRTIHEKLKPHCSETLQVSRSSQNQGEARNPPRNRSSSA